MPLPEWTEKTQKRGLDPLGLQNAGIVLYQDLVPGISNVTLRVRYFGLYCWASETFALAVGETDPAKWRSWIRRLEALHALVAQLAGGEAGIAGIEWAQRRLAVGGDPIDFAEGASVRAEASLFPDADRYLANDMGVFGQAYLTQMVEVGLFGDGENHGIPLRSERGRALAQAFAASIGDGLSELIISCIKTAKVTHAELAALAPILPSRIGAGEERDLYEAILFAAHGEASPADLSRRDTLRLLLLTAREMKKRPSSIDVRRRLFRVGDAVPKQLEPQRLRWEAYHTQDMWQVACAALLRWAISIIDEFEEGRSIPEIHAEVAAVLRVQMANRAEESWARLAAEVNTGDDAFDDRLRRTTGTRQAPADAAFAAVEQLAAIETRVRLGHELQGEIERSFRLSSGGRSIRSELQWLESRRERPVAELMAEFVIERVVKRHLWVATQKLRRQSDYTFLVEARDGRLAFRSNYEPVLTTPRLDPAVTFLNDIHLLDTGGCSPQGVRVGGLA